MKAVVEKIKKEVCSLPTETLMQKYDVKIIRDSVDGDYVKIGEEKEIPLDTIELPDLLHKLEFRDRLTKIVFSVQEADELWYSSVEEFDFSSIEKRIVPITTARKLSKDIFVTFDTELEDMIRFSASKREYSNNRNTYCNVTIYYIKGTIFLHAPLELVENEKLFKEKVKEFNPEYIVVIRDIDDKHMKVKDANLRPFKIS